MVYIRDVAHVRDGNPPQSNIVHVNGNRSVLLSVLKNGAISTLAIIQGVKDKIAEVKPGLPECAHHFFLGDQIDLLRSGAVQNVIHEGVLAAVLTSVDDPVLPRQRSARR